MRAASELPPEEHRHCRRLGGRDPGGHGLVAAHADHTQQEEAAIVSGPQLPPSFPELMGVCPVPLPIPGGFRRRAGD